MSKTPLPTDQNILNRVVRMAWEDRTTFEDIYESCGIVEADVIRIMRRELKPGSFRLWRKRVSGRITKHRKVFGSKIGKRKRKPSDRPFVNPLK